MVQSQNLCFPGKHGPLSSMSLMSESLLFLRLAIFILFPTFLHLW